MTLGAFIKTRRKTTGITQKKVSDALGWSSAQFVSNIERGTANLPADKVVKMARILKTEPEILVRLHVRQYTTEFTNLVFGK